MGFLSSLFGKKKKGKYDIEDSDGQEQYFKNDFDEPAKKSAPKQKKTAVDAASEPKKAVKAAATEKKPEAKPAPKKAAEVKEEKAPAKKSPASEQKQPEKAKSAPLPENESKAKRTGKFDIKKTKDDRFVFNLYAPNSVIVATSQVYSSSSAALNGIQSIIANAEKAPIEDNTLKNPTKQSCPKWEMYIDKGGEFRFRLFATNGNCVVHSQGYKQKSSCKNGIESIIRCAKNAEIDKSYLKKD